MDNQRELWIVNGELNREQGAKLALDQIPAVELIQRDAHVDSIMDRVPGGGWRN